jgi:hypothetical protein
MAGTRFLGQDGVQAVLAAPAARVIDGRQAHPNLFRNSRVGIAGLSEQDDSRPFDRAGRMNAGIDELKELLSVVYGE